MSYLLWYDIPSYWMWHLRRRGRALVSLCLLSPSEASDSIRSGHSILGGEMTQHISFPHLLGECNSTLIEYESEKFPQGLRQGQKVAICLEPSAKDHWNIASDLILPLVLEDYRQQHEAKRVAQAQEEKSQGG